MESQSKDFQLVESSADGRCVYESPATDGTKLRVTIKLTSDGLDQLPRPPPPPTLTLPLAGPVEGMSLETLNVAASILQKPSFSPPVVVSVVGVVESAEVVPAPTKPTIYELAEEEFRRHPDLWFTKGDREFFWRMMHPLIPIDESSFVTIFTSTCDDDEDEMPDLDGGDTTPPPPTPPPSPKTQTEKYVELLISQTGVSNEVARKTLDECDGDVVDAIMKLTVWPTEDAEVVVEDVDD